MRPLLALTVVAVVFTSSSANAILITRDAGSDDLGTAASINSVVIDNGAQTIHVNLNFLEKLTPFSLGFIVTGEDNGFLPDSENYVLTMTTVNGITSPN
ncbi:MAG: hypothetical protein ABGW78_03020, partial [Pirellulales bacterium]